MKRFALGLSLAAMLAMPGAARGFHHGGLPATTCHAAAAGSPSNDNGQSKENLIRIGKFPPALPPVGTPGEGQGEGGEHCANT